MSSSTRIAEPLFERYEIEREFESTLERRVDLPSGGYLMIDYAEALTVIDINTGSFTGRGKGGRLEDTITKVNVEAAEEVVRQLRLRDIGGIIVIDFIDMAKARNRDQVHEDDAARLSTRTRPRPYVVEVSPLGLVEMTRQNVTDGVREILTKPCPTCEGEGVVRSEETVAIDAIRKLRDLVEEQPKAEAYPDPREPQGRGEAGRGGQRTGRARGAEPASTSTSRAGRRCPSTPTPWRPRVRRAEIEERALPFKAGEEVMLTIEEPHMYDADAAVARVESYIVSVAGAARYVGERHLVRIESVARSAATGTLIDVEPGEDRGEHGEQVKSPASRGGRRGRRGGRGRGGESSKQEAASSTQTDD